MIVCAGSAQGRRAGVDHGGDGWIAQEPEPHVGAARSPRVDRARRRGRSRAGRRQAAGGEARGREGRDEQHRPALERRGQGEALGAATPRRGGMDDAADPRIATRPARRPRPRQRPRGTGRAVPPGPLPAVEQHRADCDPAGTDQRPPSRSGLRDVPARRRARSRRLRRRDGRRLRSDHRPDRGRRRRLHPPRLRLEPPLRDPLRRRPRRPARRSDPLPGLRRRDGRLGRVSCRSGSGCRRRRR